ncbi:MAG TPA: HD domain-containing protein [bacterium]|jgi:putative nucleotidyltransferase with HDIG domain
MRDELIKLIPEFNLIKEHELHENTLFAFIAAMESGGWSPKDLKKMPFTLLLDPCPATMLEHIRGVVKVAIAIAESLMDAYPGRKNMMPHMDILISGALLHDVGKFLEYEKKRGKAVKSKIGKLLRHPISGAGIAYSAGLPHQVQHAIAYHSHEGDGCRATIESIIINHADFCNFEPFKLEK